jgi:HSP20 family protein
MIMPLWDVGEPFRRFRDAMDRLFADFEQDLFAPAGAQRPAAGTFPPVNVWEDDENLYAEAELPGLRRDDLEVSVHGRELTLRGRRREPEEAEATYRRRERPVGEFVRVLELPASVDADRVSAFLENGVLTLTLPKAAEARRRRIEVRRPEPAKKEA